MGASKKWGAYVDGVLRFANADYDTVKGYVDTFLSKNKSGNVWLMRVGLAVNK